MMWRWIIRGILFVVLVVLVVHRYQRKPSVGLPVNIVTNECGPDPEDRILARPLRLMISSQGGMYLNTDPVDLQRLGMALSDIYKTRNKPVLYLDVEESVPYHDVIRALEMAETSVPRVKVLVITPSVREECKDLWRPVDVIRD